MNQHQQSLEQLKAQFLQDLSGLQTIQDGLNLKANYLGKTGPLSEILRGLKAASPEEKKILGTESNRLKEFFIEQIEQKMSLLEKADWDQKLSKEWLDRTWRNSITDLGLQGGGYHPVVLVQREIEDIFISMGFSVLDGPHIEDDYHNFEALNIPADHPARDMQDTFWFANMKNLLRTHTSCIQVRGMKEHKPPFKFIAPGKVFRCERTDASHESMFHQLEGMMVGKDISVANLIYFMKTLLSEIFEKEVEVRLRPGFFPFVEPGFELDIKCLICTGKGCSVCKQVGWVELLPCGMVHPNVLKAGGINPAEFSGFAFGLGLDRLVMMRFGIDDIRLLHSGDLRFLNQFKSF
jgi:phenylalanyl-tRNA synthetase alpha chain